MKLAAIVFCLAANCHTANVAGVTTNQPMAKNLPSFAQQSRLLIVLGLMRFRDFLHAMPIRSYESVTAGHPPTYSGNGLSLVYVHFWPPFFGRIAQKAFAS